MGTTVDETNLRALSHIILLLRAIRYAFLGMGAVFLVWGLAEPLWQSATLTPRTALEIALVSILGPALVWVSTSCGERLAKEAMETHLTLVELNLVAKHEIARRKQAVGQMRRDQETVAKALEGLQAAQQSMAEAEELADLGRQFVGVAHQLNNGIIGFSTILLSPSLGTGNQRYRARIAWEARRASGAVQKLLATAKAHGLTPPKKALGQRPIPLGALQESPQQHLPGPYPIGNRGARRPIYPRSTAGNTPGRSS